MQIEGVFLAGRANGNYRACATVNIRYDLMRFCIKGIRIISKDQGLALAWPSRRKENRNPAEFEELFFPLNREARDFIEKAVLDEYRSKYE